MIHRGNGKSHAADVGVNRIERSGPDIAVPPPMAVRQTVEAWVAEHPVTCIAAAVALGAMLGWLIKRR
jgi:ElaB/YqjD/DUF883 family membrane-anchored ribosome-binding protein